MADVVDDLQPFTNSVNSNQSDAKWRCTSLNHTKRQKDAQWLTQHWNTLDKGGMMGEMTVHKKAYELHLSLIAV